MQRFRRHIVSKIYGRIAVDIAFHRSDCGVVAFQPENEQLADIRIIFAAEEVTVLQGTPDPLWERIARAAIFQLHRELQHLKLPLDQRITLTLDPNVSAWIGDLSLAPYGGSTFGFAPERGREEGI